MQLVSLGQRAALDHGLNAMLCCSTRCGHRLGGGISYLSTRKIIVVIIIITIIMPDDKVSE